MITNGNAEQLLTQLNYELNGTEPCVTDFDESGLPNDVDKWVGAWTNSTEIEVAEALCAGCHVYDLCREYAIVAEESSYIWGGTTPQQRKEINAERRRLEKANARLAKNAESKRQTN